MNLPHWLKRLVCPCRHSKECTDEFADSEDAWECMYCGRSNYYPEGNGPAEAEQFLQEYEAEKEYRA